MSRVTQALLTADPVLAVFSPLGSVYAHARETNRYFGIFVHHKYATFATIFMLAIVSLMSAQSAHWPPAFLQRGHSFTVLLWN